MKKLLATLIIGITSLSVGIPALCGILSGDTIACGGTTHTYILSGDGTNNIGFLYYLWSVEGGVFDNGLTSKQVSERPSGGIQDVTWDLNQTGVDASLSCSSHWIIGGTDYNTQEMTIQSTTDLEARFTSVSPGGFTTHPYYANLPVGSGNYTFTATDRGVADEYEWSLTSTTPARTDIVPTTSFTISLSAYEYGTLYLDSENTGDCASIEGGQARVHIDRQIDTLEWDSGDNIMCTNSVYQFAVGEVNYATSYYWEPTGGFKVWDASISSYVTTPVSTNNQRINVKAPSTNGAGSISVTARRTGSTVLDSETLTRDLWSGIFSNPYVSGTSAVCHNSSYNYTAQVPYGSASSYSYSWLYPSGWYNYSQTNNTITLQTPTLASNMTYGTVRVSITNECGASGYSGITVYPGYNCGGYYMAAPNPASSYTDIDIASEEAKSLEASYNSDITISVVDKMGSPMFNANVESLPYRLNTAKLPNGEYVVQIISQAKERETRTEALKLIVNH